MCAGNLDRLWDVKLLLMQVIFTFWSLAVSEPRAFRALQMSIVETLPLTRTKAVFLLQDRPCGIKQITHFMYLYYKQLHHLINFFLWIQNQCKDFACMCLFTLICQHFKIHGVGCLARSTKSHFVFAPFTFSFLWKGDGKHCIVLNSKILYGYTLTLFDWVVTGAVNGEHAQTFHLIRSAIIYFSKCRLLIQLVYCHTWFLSN